jgi:hypothetical protein
VLSMRSPHHSRPASPHPCASLNPRHHHPRRNHRFPTKPYVAPASLCSPSFSFFLLIFRNPPLTFV